MTLYFLTRIVNYNKFILGKRSKRHYAYDINFVESKYKELITEYANLFGGIEALEKL